MPDNTQLLVLLQAHLAPYTHFHKQRLRFMAGLLTALLELATVNLARLALAFSAKPASNYRRTRALLRRGQAAAAGHRSTGAASVAHQGPPCGLD